MVSKSKFIELAEQSASTIQKINHLSDKVADIIGCQAFEKLYDTGVIQTIIDNLAATVEDDEGWVDWILIENEASFPITNAAWTNDGEAINFDNWANVYDFLFLKKNQNK